MTEMEDLHEFARFVAASFHSLSPSHDGVFEQCRTGCCAEWNDRFSTLGIRPFPVIEFFRLRKRCRQVLVKTRTVGMEDDDPLSITLRRPLKIRRLKLYECGDVIVDEIVAFFTRHDLPIDRE